MEGNKRLRAPMSQFIRKITGPIDLKITPCNSKDDAIKQCVKDEAAMLLIDSDDEDLHSLMVRVRSQIGTANHPFFMVRVMESWFLADRQMLANYYGRGFNIGNLRGDSNIENIPKGDVEQRLHNATRECAKGSYDKGKHAPGLLERLDPNAVYAACPNFALLIDYLREHAAA